MRINHKCWANGYSSGRKVGTRQFINTPKTLSEVLDSRIELDGYEKLDTSGYIYSITDDCIIDYIIKVEEAIRILKIQKL